MPQIPTLKTLGELLASKDEIIRRNSMSILKRLQRITDDIEEKTNINRAIGWQEYEKQLLCPKCREAQLEEMDYVGDEPRFLWCPSCEYTEPKN